MNTIRSFIFSAMLLGAINIASGQNLFDSLSSANLIYRLSHENETSPNADLHRLRLASAAYMISSGAGAAVAIHENLPSEFGGTEYGGSVRRQFLLLPGTALSPPLGGMLTHAACNVLASRPGKLGKIGVIGLIAHGVFFTVGMLGEPITYKVLNPRTFNLPKATIVVSNIVLPALMIKYGLRALKGNRHEQK